MRRYGIPILLYLLSLGLYVAWMVGIGLPLTGFAALAAYSVASLWLSWAAVMAPPVQWPSYLIVWIPAVLPLWLIDVSMRAMEKTDAAAMVVLLYLPVIAAFLLLPLISTGLLVVRRA